MKVYLPSLTHARQANRSPGMKRMSADGTEQKKVSAFEGSGVLLSGAEVQSVPFFISNESQGLDKMSIVEPLVTPSAARPSDDKPNGVTGGSKFLHRLVYLRASESGDGRFP